MLASFGMSAGPASLGPPSFVLPEATEDQGSEWMPSEKGYGWFMRDSAKLLLEEVDFVLAERRELVARGLAFSVVHRFRQAGADCLPGEEILAISLMHRGHEYQLPLSPALLLVGDYLLRNSRYAQTASQIATGIHESRFHAARCINGQPQRKRRVPRSAVKEYVKRLHRALSIVFRRAELRIDPWDVLLVERSVSNHVLYQWKAVVELVHLDLGAPDVEPVSVESRNARNPFDQVYGS